VATKRQPFGKLGPPKTSDRGRVVQGRSPTTSQRDAFESTIENEERESRARAVAAEDRARAQRAKTAKITRTGGGTSARHVSDARPPAAGPRTTATRRTGSPALRQLSRSIGRLGTRRPRQVLIAEMLGVMAVTAISDVAHKRPPTMASFVAPFAVFLILAFTAEFGDQAARLASGLGALVFVATVVAHGDGLVKALEVVTGPPARAGGGGD
jgi:hypothetical protein